MLIAKPLGTYMAHVYRGEHTFMDRIVRPVEKLTYRLCGIDETREMGVTGYAVSLVVFNLAVLLFIYPLAAIIRRRGNPASISYNPCTAAAFCLRSLSPVAVYSGPIPACPVDKSVDMDDEGPGMRRRRCWGIPRLARDREMRLGHAH